MLLAAAGGIVPGFKNRYAVENAGDENSKHTHHLLNQYGKVYSETLRQQWMKTKKEHSFENCTLIDTV